MNLAIPDELLIEGVARAFQRWLEASPDLGERLLTRMAELQCELLTPAEAADMIGLEVKTLRTNHREYGFDKSTALGPNEPRYYRSQIVEASKREGKLIKGSATGRVAKTRASLAEKITPFPKRSAPTVARAAPDPEVRKEDIAS